MDSHIKRWIRKSPRLFLTAGSAGFGMAGFAAADVLLSAAGLSRETVIMISQSAGGFLGLAGFVGILLWYQGVTADPEGGAVRAEKTVEIEQYC